MRLPSWKANSGISDRESIRHAPAQEGAKRSRPLEIWLMCSFPDTLVRSRVSRPRPGCAKTLARVMAEILHTPLTVMHVMACMFLILVVLIQPGKSGGMGIF